MARFKIDIDIDDQPVRRALQRMEDSGADLRPALVDIGEALLLSTEERFSNQVDPDGRPWKPLSPQYRKRKKHPKILTETTNLRGRIHSVVSPGRVEIGTNVVYGAIHQLGGQAGRNRAATIPARPYLGVSAEDKGSILEILREHIKTL